MEIYSLINFFELLGYSYTITADIWSFGLVMYTCALNRFPLEVEGGLFGFAQALNEVFNDLLHFKKKKK